jgi:Golgi apparatus protein 1
MKAFEGMAFGRRLNYRLSIACHETIMDKCADACTSSSIDQPCGGTVLRCLTEKLEEITDAECKKEVFYFVKMEVCPGLLWCNVA